MILQSNLKVEQAELQEAAICSFEELAFDL